jgi:DNA-binding CsgD family transcriptional regulator
MEITYNTEKTLSPRERDVLQLISWGLSQKEVADRLHISRFTVDVHIKNMKAKTGLQKATELECAFLYHKYNLPLIDLPENIRRVIAAALLALSMFTAVLHTTDMLRVMRTPRSTTTNLARRGKTRRKDEFQFLEA